MVAEPLYLLRLDVETPRLYELARRHRLPPHGDDVGYVLHSGLAALFGELGPSSFAVDRIEPRHIRLLAYSVRPLAALRERAELYADPEAYRLCDWERAADKPMPTTWRKGQRLGFRIRCCPTVRMAKDGPHHRAGAEVDAFLAVARRMTGEAKPDRQAVYFDWLRAALERTGAAHLETAVIDQFHLETLLRRTQGASRTARPSLRKPDVTLCGALTVTDPDRFSDVLRRGVGRHRAFGFGMLLLRPHHEAPC